MSQEKSAEIIDLNVSRSATAGSENAGEFLAAARTAAGLDIASVSDATKIKKSHLEAIEASDWKALPATPYVVGFIKVYATYLGLDAAELAKKFKAEVAAVTPAEEISRAQQSIADTPGDGVRMVSIIGILAVLVFVVWIGFQIAGNGQRQAEARRSEPAAPEVRVAKDAAPAPRPRIIASEERITPTEAAAIITPPVEETADDDALAAGAVTTEIVEDVPAAVEETPMTVAEETASDDAVAEEEIFEAEEENLAAANDDAADDEIVPAEDDEVVGADTEAALEPSDFDEAPILASLEPLRETDLPAATIATADIIEAQLTHSVAPVYPPRCDHTAGAFENVTVLFDVAMDGSVANARIAASSNACFEESALNAVNRWRFEPKTVNGAPRVDAGKKATLNFQR